MKTKIKANPRSRITVTTIQPESLMGQVEYLKEAVTDFSIPLADIPTTQKTGTSYDILWVIPGFGPSTGERGRVQDSLLADGVLCDLRKTTYKVSNVSPSTVYMRLQRPMGYKLAPSALAMWEPAVHGKDSLLIPLKPHTEKLFTFSNSSTSMMEPRLDMRGGSPCVHLASFCLFTEPVADTGIRVAAAAVDGIEFAVTTQYRANDGSVGKTGQYHIVSYAGTSRLDELNTGPSPSVRVCDLRLEGGNAELASILYDDKTKGAYVVFMNTKGESRKTADGLDPLTIYFSPCALSGRVLTEANDRVARFLRFNAEDPAYPKDCWVLCDVYWKVTDKTMNYNYMTFDKTKWPFVTYGTDGLTLPGETLIKPCLPFVKNRNLLRRNLGRVRTRVNATVHTAREYEGLSDVQDGVVDTLLSAMVVVLKVIEVGIEIAGMVGVLAIEPPRLPVSLAASGVHYA